VLSKPEFGLAALVVVATATWLRRPSRRLAVLVLGVGALVAGYVVVRLGPETLATCWRGYTGYDLIQEGSVPVLAAQRLFGSLLVAAAVGATLWMVTRSRSIAAVVVLLAALLLVLRQAEGSRFLNAASVIAQVTWLGAWPLLLWLGWSARHASVPAGFWVLWGYTLTLNLRWLLLGSFEASAAGPAALLFCLLVRHGVLHRPTAAGWIALVAFLLFSSVAPEIRSLRRPTPLQPVDTVLGSVRLPVDLAENIEFMRSALDAAPAGGLFVSGGGPGWYLVSRRHNPTCFDVVYTGIGTTEPEKTQILDDLRANPPVVILFERSFHGAGELSHRKIWDTVGPPDSLRLTTPDGRWTLRGVTAQ
jgi:hypothetical protein